MTKKSSDTAIHRGESETTHLKFVVKGQRVRIGVGPLAGCLGTVVERRSRGRVLVRLDHGVYVLIQNFVLEGLGMP